MSCERKWQTLLLYIILLSWMHPLQSSEEFQCGKPGRTPDTQYKEVKSGYKTGERVQYSCTKGLISYPSIRECLRNGSWSERMPVCYNPMEVTSARQSSLLSGSRETMAIDGNPDTCTSTTSKDDNTFWEGVLKASVEIKVVRITFPGNETVNVEVIIKDENRAEIQCENYAESHEDKTIIHFSCPFGAVGSYVHIRDLFRDYKVRPYFTICEVEIFLRSDPHCLFPDLPMNGRGLPVSSHTEDEYIFSCDQGYELWGDKKTFCQLDGTWSPRSPTCRKITCSTPEEIRNGRVSYDVDRGSVPFNGTAFYYCNSGFTLNGPSTIFCVRWNTWDSPPPICAEKTQKVNHERKVVRCENVPEIANGALEITSTSTGSVAKLVCNEGYRPLSVYESYCLPSGNWSNSANLLCSAIQCEINPVIPHGVGILLDNSNFYGSQLQILCNRDTNNTPILRKCQQSGTWGDLDACVGMTCDSPSIDEFSGGQWHSLNSTTWIRVLVCPPNLHIEGSPAVIQCLSNGSWSYTSAVCRENPESSHWISEWKPSTLLATAIAIGAGTAICILCLAMSCIVIRKRRQSKTNTTVFHLGMADSSMFNMGLKDHALSPNQSYGVADACEDIELRQKSFIVQPRKPRSALPHLPVDADPVYAQPFETGEISKKVSTGTMGNKDDLYNAHIYAEPVDSRKHPLGSSSMLNGAADTWFHTGTGKFSRKMSLPDCPSDIEQINCDNVNAVYESFYCSPTNSENTEFGGKFHENETENKEKYETIKNNTIYLESGNQNFPPRKSLDVELIDNDISFSECLQNSQYENIFMQ